MTDEGARAGIRVAVGVLQAPDGRVLVAERDPDRHAGGGLEFPGGKCAAGEAAEGALRRELSEELGIEVRRCEPLMRVRHAYPDRTVELETHRVTAWHGEPHGAEGQAVRWARAADLRPRDFPAANRPILAALTWPARCLITPDVDAVPDPRRLLAGVEAALGAGTAGAVQLRRSDRGSAGWWWLVEAVAAACRRQHARLLVNADPGDAERLPAGAGLHLRAAALAGITRRPVAPETPFSCAVHDAAGLRAAAAVDADCAFLGPVQATATHPGAITLGWSGVSEMAADSLLPIYALGGLGPDDVERARAAGAIGVAGIGRFWPQGQG